MTNPSWVRAGLVPLAVVAAGTGLASVFATSPGLFAYVPPCPIHALTGIDCPGCGMTRGTEALLSGDIAGAVGHNALMFLVGLPLLVLLWFYWLRTRATGRPAPRWATSPRALVVWLVLTAAFTLARNLPWPPFTALAA